MTNLTHWRAFENPDYIGAYAFQPGETKVVTIAKLTRGTVNGPDGKKEECTIVHFEEKVKPLILNACNGKMIQKLARSGYIEHWTGLQIELGVEKVKAFGEVVDAVRVKSTRLGRKAAPVPPCADCGAPIEGTAKVTAAQMAAATQRRFGEPLCTTCAKMRTEAQKQTPDENQAATVKEDTKDEDHEDQDQ